MAANSTESGLPPTAAECSWRSGLMLNPSKHTSSIRTSPLSLRDNMLFQKLLLHIGVDPPFRQQKLAISSLNTVHKICCSFPLHCFFLLLDRGHQVLTAIYELFHLEKTRLVMMLRLLTSSYSSVPRRALSDELETSGNTWRLTAVCPPQGHWCNRLDHRLVDFANLASHSPLTVVAKISPRLIAPPCTVYTIEL